MNDDNKNPIVDKQADESTDDVVAKPVSEPIVEPETPAIEEKPDLPASASEALQAGEIEAPQKPEEIEAPAEEKLIEAVEEDGKIEPSSAEATEEQAKEPVEETPAPSLPSDKGKWYIVHTYSGHENKVAKSLHQRMESMGFEDRIFEIIVPTRDTVKVTGGKKENVKEKIFPGYVLVKMILDDESWLLVRTTQGVTAFIGAGNKPTPISDKEVEVIQKFMATEQPLYKAAFTVGEAVKIVDGPFADFLGSIDSIDEAKGKLKVLVSIFGRETPVELDFLQVTKL
nr:transcription termination/antitermination factor NusG [Candidatus Levybacteria bacterium]